MDSWSSYDRPCWASIISAKRMDSPPAGVAEP
jgi:hypothetical protein